MDARHTDREYEEELRSLEERILLMGRKVQAMIAGSVRALVGRNTGLAEEIIDADHEVDRLEIETDDHCLSILARRQPVASDLRFIATALKVVTDLERIADLATNICERVIELNREPPLQSTEPITLMADEVQAMFKDALEAFLSRDDGRARQILLRDDVVDAAFAKLFRELLATMLEDSSFIRRAIRLQAVAKYLERIADHATNLAEMVVFMSKGQDIRHPHSRDAPRRRAVVRKPEPDEG